MERDLPFRDSKGCDIAAVGRPSAETRLIRPVHRVLPALVLPIQAANAFVFCPRSLHSWVGSADTLQVRESLAILWIQSEGRLIVSGGSNEISLAFKNSCPHHVRGF